jgi:hypothetical protein
MSYSVTLSESETAAFTVTHARHIAVKVATDLKRLQRFYGAPSDSAIARYETELIAYLKAGYLDTVTYGFRRNGSFIEPTLIYTAHDLMTQNPDDDDPGRVRPGADISNATFYTYLTNSAAWDRASAIDRMLFQAGLPFTRGDAPQPTVSGYVTRDRTYSAGGRSLERATVRALS